MAHLVSTRFYFDYFLSLNFSLPSTPTTYFAQSWPLRDHLNLVPRTDTNTIASNDIGSNFFFTSRRFEYRCLLSMCPWLPIRVRWSRGVLRTQIPSPASSEISVLVSTSKCFFFKKRKIPRVICISNCILITIDPKRYSAPNFIKRRGRTFNSIQ